METNESNTQDNDQLYIGFIRLIGPESDGIYNYEFIFTNNIDEFWGENFEYKPCCLCNDLIPNDEYITEIHKIRTKIKFDLVQDNCCFSMQDCMDGIISLAWENIDEYEEYPEDGRLVFNFGETYDEVERKLALKNILIID